MVAILYISNFKWLLFLKANHAKKSGKELHNLNILGFLFIYCYKPLANQRIIIVIYCISIYCNGYLLNF